MTVMFERQQTGNPFPAAASSIAQQDASNTPQEEQNVGAEDSCELSFERKTRFLIAGYKKRKALLGKKRSFR